MVRCLACKKNNEKNESTCKYCGTILPNEMNERKIFSLDEIGKMEQSAITKEFSIKDFLEDNYRLFTILGIFGGLSYYLTNLVLNPNTSDTGSFITTISNTTTSLTTTNTPSISMMGLTPTILLQFGILLSYLVFVGVLGN